MNSVIIIFIIGVLLILSGFFSGAETAFSTINIIRIKQYTKSNKKNMPKRARRVLKIDKSYSKFLSTILVCNNIVNISSASLTTYLFTTLYSQGEKGVIYATLFSSLFVIIFAEILPKTLSRNFPEKIALYSSSIVSFLMKLFTPITMWFEKIDERINSKYEIERVTATENELIEIVETIEKEGVLEHVESELIQSAITFDDISVKSAMTPKEKVIYIDSKDTFDDITKKFHDNRFSRLPVYDKELNKAIGIVYQRDVFESYYQNKKSSLSELMKEAFYISHRRLLPYALEHLQRNKSHLAIVVDNLKDKEFLGILTLEDVIEELVGEIYDEYDDSPKSVFEIGNHLYHVSGKVLLDVFFDEHLDEIDPPKTKSKTFAGWIKELIGAARKNDVVYYENLKIKVLEAEDGVINLLEVEVLTDFSEDD